MWVVMYRYNGRWASIKRAKTKSGAMAQMRAHKKRFGFGMLGEIMGDQYRIEEER